jgi:hypothetical protein
METSLRDTILHKSLQILAYADDIIIGRYRRTVKDAYTKLKKPARQMRLTTDREKTKFVEVSNNKTKNIGNKKIEKVSKFQYLGSIVTCDAKY